MYLTKKKKQKKGALKISMRKKFCSPEPGNNKSKYTCFTKNSLIEIAKNINKHRKGKKINIKMGKKKLWESINKQFSNCKHEWCWITQQELKNIHNKLKTNFRPEMPDDWYDDDREWLSTVDIEDSMEQYENSKHNDFWFIGAVPIDFDSNHSLGGCVVDELCEINIEELYKNDITKLGVVFNLDRHDEPGSHWVSLYCDIKKKQVLYYDSYGYKPPKEVDIFMNRLKKQIDKLFDTKDTKLKYNNIRHQYKDSECGVYSMYFIISLLNGKSFDNFTKRVNLDDDEVHKKRGEWFTPSKILV